MIKVMIVDDEIVISEGIKQAIDWQSYGMEVCAVAGSGNEALEIMELCPPDIVILDIMLNDMDGLEVLDLVRHKYPNTYVILISGYDDFGYAQRAIELNAFCYLLKPLDENQLREKLLQISENIKKRFEKLKRDRELNERLRESIPILRDKFLYEIVMGKNTNKSSIDSKADFLEVDLKAGQYAVIILELSNVDYRNEYDKNLMKYAVMDICTGTFSGAYKCYPFNIQENIGLLICADSMEQSEIREMCCNIRDKVNRTLGILLTVGVGRPCNELLSVQYSYGEAADALEYKIIMGLNRIIDSEAIYKSANKKYEHNLLKEVFDKRSDELKIALKAMNNKTVYSITAEIISALHTSINNNIKNCNRNLLILSSYLTGIVISLDVNVDRIFEEGKELYGTFRQLETIEKIKECIEAFFRRIMENLKDRQKDSNNSYVDKALECIKENLNGEISLTTVADSLYVSSNYLSRIFRQKMGEPFIEYTIRLKMNEAKRLLETSNQKVYEIANELNYKDVNYFTKTFKRTFGVTPSEYRELL